MRQVTLHQYDGKRLLRCGNQTELLFIGHRIYIPFDGLGSRQFPATRDELPAWIDAFLKKGNDTFSLMEKDRHDRA